MKAESVNTTRVYELPLLTNSVELEEGEELILEIEDKPAEKKAQKRTWRDAYKEEEAAKAKAKATQQGAIAKAKGQAGGIGNCKGKRLEEEK